MNAAVLLTVAMLVGVVLGGKLDRRLFRRDWDSEYEIPESCIASNGNICNNHGSCIYGQCQCEEHGYYMGPTCEDCPSCPGQCERLKNCVKCAFGQGPLSAEECYRRCRNSNMQHVDQLPSDDPDSRLCLYRDEDGCIFKFTYKRHSDGTLDVRVPMYLECPPPQRK